jgi:hypothetical protein
MEHKKHLIYLTNEAKESITDDPILQATYKGLGFGFEVFSYELNLPFLHLVFEPEKKIHLEIPIHWVKYIASEVEEKSLGFLLQNDPEN